MEDKYLTGTEMKGVGKISILRVTQDDKSSIEEIVVRESYLTIVLNNHKIVSLLCSPINIGYLAVGFLASEGLLKGREDIKKMEVDDEKGVVRVETVEDKGLPEEALFGRVIASSGGRETADFNYQGKVGSLVTISAHEVFALTEEFKHRSYIYRATHGVHSAALCDRSDILIFAEDIGRHNAIDKIFGECILNDIPTDNRIVITSGRISSEILLKVVRRDIPIIVSVSAPTDLAVRLANDLGVTLAGFARGERMNVYTHDWRVETG